MLQSLGHCTKRHTARREKQTISTCHLDRLCLHNHYTSFFLDVVVVVVGVAVVGIGVGVRGGVL